MTVLAEYGQRENTRREHAALIRQHYQYREFAWPWTFRLTRLLYTRSWISNERPGLLFDLATGWLMQYVDVGATYYFNKNMSTYVDYKINLLDDNSFTRNAGISTDDVVALGLVYQF
ncbi:porin [Klebsiella pneumoniae]|uniref:porin n=1 Tax=Klebsiella pneumoniae TaxID=573 RepID=UPI002B1BD78D|nr:porin [Klebsiella pneumoniae]